MITEAILTRVKKKIEDYKKTYNFNNAAVFSFREEENEVSIKCLCQFMDSTFSKSEKNSDKRMSNFDDPVIQTMLSGRTAIFNLSSDKAQVANIRGIQRRDLKQKNLTKNMVTYPLLVKDEKNAVIRCIGCIIFINIAPEEFEGLVEKCKDHECINYSDWHRDFNS